MEGRIRTIEQIGFNPRSENWSCWHAIPNHSFIIKDTPESNFYLLTQKKDGNYRSYKIWKKDEFTFTYTKKHTYIPSVQNHSKYWFLSTICYWVRHWELHFSNMNSLFRFAFTYTQILINHYLHLLVSNRFFPQFKITKIGWLKIFFEASSINWGAFSI